MKATMAGMRQMQPSGRLLLALAVSFVAFLLLITTTNGLETSMGRPYAFAWVPALALTLSYLAAIAVPDGIELLHRRRTANRQLDEAGRHAVRRADAYVRMVQPWLIRFARAAIVLIVLVPPLVFTVLAAPRAIGDAATAVANWVVAAAQGAVMGVAIVVGIGLFCWVVIEFFMKQNSPVAMAESQVNAVRSRIAAAKAAGEPANFERELAAATEVLKAARTQAADNKKRNDARKAAARAEATKRTGQAAQAANRRKGVIALALGVIFAVVVWVLVLIALIGVVILAWVAYGFVAGRVAIAISEKKELPANTPTDAFAMLLLTWTKKLRELIGRGTSIINLDRLRRRQARSQATVADDDWFMTNVAVIERQTGEVVTDHPWLPAANADDATLELAELVNGLLGAYDTRLAAGVKPPKDQHDPEVMGRPQGGKRYPNYRLSATVTADPEKFGVIIEVDLPGVAAAAHEIPEKQILTVVAATTSWSVKQLADLLTFDDDRLQAIARRIGVKGLFITYARTSADAHDQVPDPDSSDFTDEVVAAVHRGLKETGKPTTYFRLKSAANGGGPIRTYNRIIYRFSSPHWTTGSIAKREELTKDWSALKNAVKFYADIPSDDIKTIDYDPKTRSFVIEIAVEPPPFPKAGDEKVSLVKFLREGRDRAADPWTFCLGTKFDGDYAYGNIVDMPHVLFTGTTGSTKSTSGGGSSILQLAYKHGPDELELVVVDTKREMFRFFGDLPHTVDMFVPKSLEDVVPMLKSAYEDAAARRDQLNGDDWHPRAGFPRRIILLEEWFALIKQTQAMGNDSKQLIEQAESWVQAIVAIARSSGVHVFLATQEIRNDVLPKTLSRLLPLKLIGYGYDGPMLRAAFDEDVVVSEVKVPKGAKGRFGVTGADDESDKPFIVQALWSDDPANGKPPPDIKSLIAEIVAKWPKRQRPEVREANASGAGGGSAATAGFGGSAATPGFGPAGTFTGRGTGEPELAPDPAPSPTAGRPLTDAELAEQRFGDISIDWPRRPNQAGITSGDKIEYVRLVWDWQSERHASGLPWDEWTPDENGRIEPFAINRDTLRARIKAIGLIAPDTELLTKISRWFYVHRIVQASSRDSRKRVPAALSWPAAYGRAMIALEAEELGRAEGEDVDDLGADEFDEAA